MQHDVFLFFECRVEATVWFDRHRPHLECVAPKWQINSNNGNIIYEITNITQSVQRFQVSRGVRECGIKIHDYRFDHMHEAWVGGVNNLRRTKLNIKSVANHQPLRPPSSILLSECHLFFGEYFVMWPQFITVWFIIAIMLHRSIMCRSFILNHFQN